MTKRGYCGIGFYNPKREENIGAGFRCSHCFGVDYMVVAGERWRRYNSDTTNATKHIPTFYCKEPDDIDTYIPDDTAVIGVEFTDDSSSLVNFCHPRRAFYIFGPENASIPDHILKKCHNVLKIPTQHCLNLGVSTGIVLYDRVSKEIKRKCTKSYSTR